MGFYDRDYYREDPSRGSVLGGTAPACVGLIAVNVVVYILQTLTIQSPDGGVTGWFDLSPEDVFERFQVWRLLTSAFCHHPDAVLHLVFNMFGLWIFGSMIESIYGSREFVRFYLTAAFVSAVGYLGVEKIMSLVAEGHQIHHELGASGAVMGVMMLCATYYPRMTIMIMFVIPVELRWLVGIYIVYDLLPILRQLGGAQVLDHVAHATHLAGLLYGFLYKKYDLRFSRLLADFYWPGWKKAVRTATARKPRNVKLYSPPDEPVARGDLDRRVDEILAKITAHGEASLTDAERNTLKEASQRYKKR
jgi:membrane associated rhomboid family serine protease